MFMPTIANQGTEEQKDFFLRPAEKYQIIGCYAQTEVKLDVSWYFYYTPPAYLLDSVIAWTRI
jgi:Acyl-coenzyme A oxidase N-terminal